MISKPFKKIPLNKYSYSVRASQAVLQYGVGAMVDFPDQTLMTAAPEFWQEEVTQIHDERLEKALHVDYFGLPLDKDDPKSKNGISYVRFPEWYFCPKCRTFQPLSKWISEYRRNIRQSETDPEMTKKLKCSICKQDLVVSRIVTACEHGHIDDFPWVKWVHCQNSFGGAKPICSNPVLTFKTAASSGEGLEGLSVTCETCKAKATLRGAFDKNKFEDLDKKTNKFYDFSCTGKHPWKNTKESCDCYPKVLQRGSSSVYFPIKISSLVIPPYSSIVTQRIEDSSSYSKAKDIIASYKRSQLDNQTMTVLVHNQINDAASDIHMETGLAINQIKTILERKWINGEDSSYSATSIRYREEEYEALSGEILSIEGGDFVREPTNSEDYNIFGIKNISLIHKIREVQALTGFSRLKPVEYSEEATNEYYVSVRKDSRTNWYPAYQVRGEGIFIEFDENAISLWIRDNADIQRRVDIINENYKKSYIGQNRERKISAKFLLIHTLSHLLIKQLSFECGYSIASLKERIYCSDESDGRKMAGLLIYTASGDSEGTLGGLVRQGRPDVFPSIFKKAVETSISCSNDPVCSLSNGQGRDSLNLAACYSCSLIPETGCEEFNEFLDRGTIIGTYENRDMGFYSCCLEGRESWIIKKDVASERNSEDKKNKKEFIIIDQGTDLSGLKYTDIWQDLLEWSDNKNETNLLNELKSKSNLFQHIEKPYKDCMFMITGERENYICDLYWKNKKIAFFTSDHKDDFLAAQNTTTRCILGEDNTINVEKILDLLQKEA